MLEHHCQEYYVLKSSKTMANMYDPLRSGPGCMRQESLVGYKNID